MQRNLLALELREAYKLDSSGTTVAEKFESPAQLINKLIPNVYVIAGLLLFFFVFGAGMQIVMNPDSSKKAEEGKKAIGFAVTGFAILIGAYWIIQILQVLLNVEILG